MNSDVMVPCKKCGNKVPSSSLKLDLDEKMVICQDCIKNKKIHKEIEKEVFHKQESPAFAKKEPQIIQRHEEPAPSRIGHKCTSCGYKFKIDPESKTPKNCPYCNNKVFGY